jgi:hypothetical protein
LVRHNITQGLVRTGEDRGHAIMAATDEHEQTIIRTAPVTAINRTLVYSHVNVTRVGEVVEEFCAPNTISRGPVHV